MIFLKNLGRPKPYESSLPQMDALHPNKIITHIANFEVSDVGENKVMFLFQQEEDLDRVLMLSPWSFEKYLLVLHKL